MSTSRARLVACAPEGATRLTVASATAPQRWNLTAPGRGGTLEATHQLLGDGVFGGDCHRLTVFAGPGASLTVRAASATPLRAGPPSATITLLRAGAGATLRYLPGALVPHAGADHSTLLRIEAHPDARVIAASILTPGRTAHGERAVFNRLAQRTSVRIVPRFHASDRPSALAFAEHVSVEPGTDLVDSRAMFASNDALLTVIAIGNARESDPDWWPPVAATAGITGGASRLRLGGVLFRALCSSLGTALAAVQLLECRLS